MRELERILTAWAEHERNGEEAVLATVVDVKGSAYRKPGARMLMTAGGQRIGSISGGCLEGDVAKKAWWWTESGHPVVRTYDTTSEEDAVWEFGLGCNGVVRVLLERLARSSNLIEFLNACSRRRVPGAIATVIAAPRSGDFEIGQRLLVSAEGEVSGVFPGELRAVLARQAMNAIDAGQSRLVQHVSGSGVIEVFVEVIAPPVPLTIFGAGHDAIPVVALSKELGWHVTVADGRPAYAQAGRFPLADEVVLTRRGDPLASVRLEADAVAVIMNHNYFADRAVLEELLRRPMRYIGLLGPRARAERMLAELGYAAAPEMLHAPIGLDIGADTPESIALSIVSEIQAVLADRPGSFLRSRFRPLEFEKELYCATR